LFFFLAGAKFFKHKTGTGTDINFLIFKILNVLPTNPILENAENIKIINGTVLV